MFQKHFTNLEFSKNIDIGYFKKLINFIINNNFIIHKSKMYVQVAGIAQGGCSSIMLADLFLYYYESNFINTLHLYS